ncbi:MAG: transposase [Sphingobacteriales bacterium]|nr:transposase [Sphingobacteriales bacterium]
MGTHLSIDEVSLSQGELYTFITNKNGRGKKGSLIASVKGTLSQDIIGVLLKINENKRLAVKEVTLDMAKNMEALQHLRVKLRWQELDTENKAIDEARKAGRKYEPEALSNGDTPKQLLARSRYILTKKSNEWTENQHQRATLLFARHPELQKAYEHTLHFRNIYEQKNPNSAKTMFNEWITKTHTAEMKTFYTVANTVKNNLDNILNFFINRNTNANAESFNSKIKLFRANLRGVAETKFFLFRLYKLFA